MITLQHDDRVADDHYLTAQSAGPHHAATPHLASSSSFSSSPSAASAAPSSGAAATTPSGTAGYALATWLNGLSFQYLDYHFDEIMTGPRHRTLGLRRGR